jgi:hypothetical protein
MAVSAAAAAGTLTIVLGPLTDLGACWLRFASANAFDICVVARHETDAARLRAAWPNAAVILAGDRSATWPQGCRQLVLCGCAVGLIHPRKPDWAADVAAADRDIRLHEEILAAYSSVPIHVIYVSSVLALSPRGTAHYAGWKNVVLGTLAGLIAATPNARLSVLYPGRLIKKRLLGQPASLVSTLHEHLAARIGRIASSGKSTRRVIGIDAHLWLLARGLPTWLVTMSGSSRD